jgi:hypothetical protein
MTSSIDPPIPRFIIPSTRSAFGPSFTREYASMTVA